MAFDSARHCLCKLVAHAPKYVLQKLATICLSGPVSLLHASFVLSAGLPGISSGVNQAWSLGKITGDEKLRPLLALGWCADGWSQACCAQACSGTLGELVQKGNQRQTSLVENAATRPSFGTMHLGAQNAAGSTNCCSTAIQHIVALGCAEFEPWLRGTSGCPAHLAHPFDRGIPGNGTVRQSGA